MAQAFVLGAEHIGDGPVALVLGDNIFYGHGMGTQLRRFSDIDGGAIFGYRVADPTAYGVVEFDASGRAISLEEKPENPKSHYAVPGLYFYDNDVVEIARNLKPSARGELEITDVNRVYLERGKLQVEILAWRLGFLSDEELLERAAPLAKSGYGRYLLDLLAEDAAENPERLELSLR